MHLSSSDQCLEAHAKAKHGETPKMATKDKKTFNSLYPSISKASNKFQPCDPSKKSSKTWLYNVYSESVVKSICICPSHSRCCTILSCFISPKEEAKAEQPTSSIAAENNRGKKESRLKPRGL